MGRIFFEYFYFGLLTQKQVFLFKHTKLKGLGFFMDTPPS